MIGSIVGGSIDMGVALLKIGVNATAGVAGLLNFKSHLQEIAGTMTSVGTTMGLAGTAMNAALVPVAVKALKTFAGIGQATQEIGSMSEGLNVEGLADTIEEIGLKTQWTQQQIANASRQIAQAGYLGDSTMKNMIEVTSDFAAAVGDDLPHSVGLMIGAMESMTFGQLGEKDSADNLRRIAQAMSDVQVASRAEAEDLEYFLQQMGSLMAIENADPRKMLAAFGTINQVMGSGARSATAMRQSYDMLLRLPIRRDLDRLGVTDALKKAGMTLDDLNPRIHGYGEAARRAATAGLDKLAGATLLFGVQGKNAISLIGSAGGINRVLTTMNSLAPVADRAKKNLNTLRGAWMLLTSSIEAAYNVLGRGLSEDEGIRKLLLNMKDAINGFVEWLKANRASFSKWFMDAIKFSWGLMKAGAGLAVLGKGLSLAMGLLSPKTLVAIGILSLFYRWLETSSTGLARFKQGLQSAWSLMKQGDFAGGFKKGLAAFNEVPIFRVIKDGFLEVTEAARIFAEMFSKGLKLDQLESDNKIVVWAQKAQEVIRRVADIVVRAAKDIGGAIVDIMQFFGVPLKWDLKGDGLVKGFLDAIESIQFAFEDWWARLKYETKKKFSELGLDWDTATIGQRIGVALLMIKPAIMGLFDSLKNSELMQKLIELGELMGAAFARGIIDASKVMIKGSKAGELWQTQVDALTQMLPFRALGRVMEGAWAPVDVSKTYDYIGAQMRYGPEMGRAYQEWLIKDNPPPWDSDYWEANPNSPLRPKSPRDEFMEKHGPKEQTNIKVTGDLVTLDNGQLALALTGKPTVGEFVDSRVAGLMEQTQVSHG